MGKKIHDTEPHLSSVRRNACVSQDLIQTMIYPSRCSRSESSRAARQAREVGRRLREWFESRPYTGGVVPSTCNYRKLASFCRAVSCPPFLSFLLVSRHSLCARARALLSSRRAGRGIADARFERSLMLFTNASHETGVTRTKCKE